MNVPHTEGEVELRTATGLIEGEVESMKSLDKEIFGLLEMTWHPR